MPPKRQLKNQTTLSSFLGLTGDSGNPTKPSADAAQAKARKNSSPPSKKETKKEETEESSSDSFFNDIQGSPATPKLVRSIKSQLPTGGEASKPDKADKTKATKATAAEDRQAAASTGHKPNSKEEEVFVSKIGRVVSMRTRPVQQSIVQQAPQAQRRREIQPSTPDSLDESVSDEPVTSIAPPPPKAVPAATGSSGRRESSTLSSDSSFFMTSLDRGMPLLSNSAADELDAASRPPSTSTESVPKDIKPGALKDLTFVVTGILGAFARSQGLGQDPKTAASSAQGRRQGYGAQGGRYSADGRTEVVNFIRGLGGRITEGLSGRTSFLIIGDNPGPAKVAKARDLGTKTMTETEFIAFLRKLSPAAPQTAQTERQERQERQETAGEAETETDKALHKGTQEPRQIKTKTKTEEEEEEEQEQETKQTTQTKTSTRSKPKPTPKPTADNKPRSPSPTTPTTSSSSSSSNELWVDRYAPKSVAEIVGHASNISKLQQWLKGWSRVHISKEAPKAVDKANRDILECRAVLVCGLPGIGKTSACSAVAHALGFRVLEMNASDTRSAKEIRMKVQEAARSHVLMEGEGPRVIIMDEVDGMGAGDRGGAAALGKVIDHTKVPIILIANDKMKNRKLFQTRHRAYEMVFRKPTAQQIEKRVKYICTKEGVALEPQVVTQLAEMTNGDIRQIINVLQSICEGEREGKHSVSFSDTLTVSRKISPLGIYDAVSLIFAPVSHGRSYRERLDLHFSDTSLMPLFVFENAPLNTHSVSSYFNACALMSLGDVLDRGIIYDSLKGLSVTRGVVGSVLPPVVASVGQQAGAPKQAGYSRTNFPSVLGKESSQRARLRELADMTVRMKTKEPLSSGESLVSWGGWIIRNRVLEMLDSVAEAKGAQKDSLMEAAVNVLARYNIGPDQWDFLMKRLPAVRVDLGIHVGAKDPAIPTATKTKFTKLLGASVIKDPTEAFRKERGSK